MTETSKSSFQQALDGIPDSASAMQRLVQAIDPVRLVVRLNSEDVARNPELVWNAFVCIVASRQLRELRANQAPASLAFWYDAEVQNGGHAQYFANSAGGHAPETVQGLRLLGAEGHATLLARAIDAAAQTDLATNDVLGRLDEEYHSLRPSLMEVLEAHLTAHQEHYVEIRSVT